MNRIFVATSLVLSLGVAPYLPFERLWFYFATLGEVPITKAGCIADPNGRCLPAFGLPSDAGCGADPDGRCLPEPQPASKAGCTADPNGKPLCS